MYVAKFMVSYLVKLYLFKIILRLYQNHTPTLPKSHSDFHKITLPDFHRHHKLTFHKITFRLYQNHTPTLHKITLADFTQNHWLIFTKSHADFTKITLQLYQNRRLIFTKSLTDFHKNEGWFWRPRLLFYCTPFQNRTPLPHCASCLSEGFSSFVTSLPGSPHCFCPCLWKKNLVLFTGSSCLAFHHFAVLR